MFLFITGLFLLYLPIDMQEDNHDF